MMPVSASTPDWIIQALAERKSQDLYRSVNKIQGPQSTRVVQGGKSYLSFCSNDYLGLANHPDLKQAMADAALEMGVGSGASHLVCGHLNVHDELERALATWLGYERVMLFSTGYMANLAVISALGGKDRPIIMDKLNHASLIDGAQLSGAPFRRYLHGNVQSAKKLIERSDLVGVLATDGVFSMDGDIAPLKELADLASDHQWLLMVDDAHGLGCLGQDGRGALDLAGLNASHVPLLMGTFGKAFGVAGAFVACSNDLAEYLTQFARPFIYTTAMPPAVAATVLKSLEVIRSGEGHARRCRLASNIELFRSRALRWPAQLMVSDSAIQPLIVGSNVLALSISNQLKAHGILCTAIRPPTVPANTARIRITLSAEHSHTDVNDLCDTLDHIFNDLCK